MKLMPFKTLVLILGIAVFSCSSETQYERSKEYTLDRYSKFSTYTDPGEFAYLFDGLPDSLDNLCALIKKQLIHPFDVGNFNGKIPENRKDEGRDFPTVSMMLRELLKRNGKGIVISREPDERLVASSAHHSKLLASILRKRGIPVRIRAGFAKYIGNKRGLRISKVICEVWDKNRNSWILVDPDRQKIDIPRDKFEFANETWGYLKRDRLNGTYFVPVYGSVDRTAVHLICHDLYYLIGNEDPYGKDPYIVSKIESGIEDLSKDEFKVLDRIAKLISEPDKNMDKLMEIQRKTPFLSF